MTFKISNCARPRCRSACRPPSAQLWRRGSGGLGRLAYGPPARFSGCHINVMELKFWHPGYDCRPSPVGNRGGSVAPSRSISSVAHRPPGTALPPWPRPSRLGARLGPQGPCGHPAHRRRSTFDYPFFSKAFYNYSQAHSDVTVNYQSIGSGGGIQQFTAKTVDFGATDVPMNSEELQRAKDPVVQFPSLWAVSRWPTTCRVSSRTAAHPRGARRHLSRKDHEVERSAIALNPGAKLPNPRSVVHRSDGSGTTYIFTDFLSHVSPEWKSKVGAGKDVQWPAPHRSAVRATRA